jgi:hypothetical protein
MGPECVPVAVEVVVAVYQSAGTTLSPFFFELGVVVFFFFVVFYCIIDFPGREWR